MFRASVTPGNVDKLVACIIFITCKCTTSTSVLTEVYTMYPYTLYFYFIYIEISKHVRIMIVEEVINYSKFNQVVIHTPIIFKLRKSMAYILVMLNQKALSV